MDDKNQQKQAKKYLCKFCDYTTSKKYNFNQHILTDKHVRITKDDVGLHKIAKTSSPNDKQFICSCGKKYLHRQGLWKHKKNCNYEENIKKDIKKDIKESEKNSDDKEIIMMLIKQNSELMKEHSDIKELILEIVKNGTMNNSNNTTNNNTNSHNKAFNLNFFLNETCKNAMNISDFVDSIKLQLSDLMEVGELGYVEGISKIIVNKLNSLDETIRPLHCTDKKRETIYIKDEGHWEKDDDNKSRLRKSIKKISDKNIKLLQVFREKYPDCREADSIYCNKYCKMVIEAMGGMGSTTAEKEDKIIRNITKVTTINKFN
jgi:hypothetical protein